MIIYKCFAEDFETLQKRINRITKKLDKHNLKWKFEKLEETIENVQVIDYRNLDNIPTWQFTPKNLGTRAVKVINYTFDMEELKLGNYDVIAMLEHDAVKDSNENIIHNFSNIEIPKKYRTTKSICEHCNSKRHRNKTVLLKDHQGNIKQIGTSCIKEYTGIDAADIISIYTDIHDICIMGISIDYNQVKNQQTKYIKTMEYLANCINLINKKGYIKDITKFEAWDTESNNQDILKAEEIINYFTNRQFDNDFLNNIKIYLSAEYTKINGCIAYAPIAYEKQLEVDRIKQLEAEQKANSDYKGNIGDKLEVELILKNKYSYETAYGYQTMYIFNDSKGNIYKWNTQNYIDNQIGDTISIKGTIKDHTEYKGEKQTVLTRCKIK